MNAISPIASDVQSPPLPRDAKWSGDQFRSRFIDKLAEVETWAVGRIRAAADGKKMPATCGLRLAAVRKLTETHPELFKKPAIAAGLLDELRTFHDLRSSLAHSKMIRVQAQNGGILYVFERADASATMPWDARLAIRQCEFGLIIKQVSDVANRIAQQTPSSRA